MTAQEPDGLALNLPPVETSQLILKAERLLFYRKVKKRGLLLLHFRWKLMIVMSDVTKYNKSGWLIKFRQLYFRFLKGPFTGDKQTTEDKNNHQSGDKMDKLQKWIGGSSHSNMCII